MVIDGIPAPAPATPANSSGTSSGSPAKAQPQVSAAQQELDCQAEEAAMKEKIERLSGHMFTVM